MELAGFHGCVASTDATHVSMNRCPVLRANEHLGKKESLPARTYNISVNHRRQILHTTRGHPARWNDKTLVLFDEFIMQIKNGDILSANEFYLLELDDKGEAVKKGYNGCWVLCDNGYQNWPVLMAPMKNSIFYKDLRWSKWVESIRKDVECTFGIMKGRFRILKIGIRIHSIAAVDKLWCTCCALHNMFLEDDGLSETWKTGTDSDWQGELGHHSIQDTTDTMSDMSGMGFGNNRLDEDDDNDNNEGNDGNTNNMTTYFNNTYDSDESNDIVTHTTVHLMRHSDFRQKLIDHFDILFEREQIRWPTRNGLLVPDI
jgi:Plant transposon protein